VSRGKKHDYLGMDLNFSIAGEVKITMIDYLKGVLEDFRKVIVKRATSLASDQLFTVQPDDERNFLDEPRALAFHHSVAQLLFASTRARKYIQATVDFPTTPAREPYDDDLEKLRRLLRYVGFTINIPLIIRVYSLNIIK
jgi:hypothetical protein